jgi:hypothetical protein
MPRPVSWLPRLHEIRRSVDNSVRSHYDRRDLERLFELQPRAAQKLLELLPTLTVGTSRLVEREALATFLERVREADDTSKLIEQIRQEKSAPSRRSLRTLVRRDAEPASLTVTPEGMSLERGRLEISFRNLEQLAESLVYLARLLDGDLDGFAQAYEPEAPPRAETNNAAGEVQAMFGELEQREAEHAAVR